MKKMFAVLAMAMCLFTQNAYASSATSTEQGVAVQLIRNASVKVSYAGTTFLIDPMLAEQGAYPGFEQTYRSELRNPLTPLPFPVADILRNVDAVIVTHTHLDHWDEAAQKALPKNIVLFAQDEVDAAMFRSQGFTNVRVLESETTFKGVHLTKTGGQHGSNAMYAIPALAKSLGNTMGIVFKAPGMKTVYLAGDTIWREEVERAITEHKPEAIVLNTGAAAMNIPGLEGEPFIIMGKEDTLRASKLAPSASIIAVHMDAINHMTVDRKDLSEYARQQGIRDKVLIPFDGETIRF